MSAPQIAQDIQQRIATMYLDDVPYNRIAAETGVTRATAWRVLQRHGVPRRREIANPARRFWSRIQVGPTCWIWIGTTDELGYGRCWLDGRHWPAHRLMYEAMFGPIPTGLIVRHRCDNPPCVHPDHLLLGTDRDNKDDCVARDRQAKGNRFPQAKLNPDLVRSIRADPRASRLIAEELGVTHSAVLSVRNRKTWRHVP